MNDRRKSPIVQPAAGQIVQTASAQLSARSKVQSATGQIVQSATAQMAPKYSVFAFRQRRRTVNPRRHQRRIAPTVFNADRVMIPRAVLQDTFDRYLGFGNGDAE